MTQIITTNGGGGGGGGGASYTAGCGIDITNNEISVDESVVQTTDNLVTNLTDPDDTHYPSAKAVSDAITSSGGGDMLKSVYDPNNVNANAFDYNNFTNTPIIPTDNCQLANGCCYAKTCDIPTDNCQLGNGCGYTTCTGTLTASNISNTAYGSSWCGVTTVAPSKNAIYAKVNSIDELIPSAATCSNKLTDKNYVDDSINSVTAYYITKNAQGDQFATYAELAAATTFYSGGVVRVPTRNDYTIVLDDETHSDEVTRYIYNSGWEYQYTINESPLTQAQLDALNSGITAAKVSAYDSIPVITDNCQIANGCGYTTCTGNLSCGDNVSCLCNDAGYLTTAPVTSVNGQTGAVSLSIPTNNCELTNGCGYTTCTGTLSADNAGSAGQVLTKTSTGACWCNPAGGCMRFVDVLVVGGGGGGSVGGGGGGQVIECIRLPLSKTSITVTVGAGGAGTTVTAVAGFGGNSCFDCIVALGGGGGGGCRTCGNPRGSGGGGGGCAGGQGNNQYIDWSGGNYNVYSNKGGAGKCCCVSSGSRPLTISGGGGGGHFMGGDAPNAYCGGVGGYGVGSSVLWACSTISRHYLGAGGGGGGCNSSADVGAGSGSQNGTNGCAAPYVCTYGCAMCAGGGGGGSAYYNLGTNCCGGSGAKGIVVVGYFSTYGISSATGGTKCSTTRGGATYTYHIFCNSGTFSVT